MSTSIYGKLNPGLLEIRILELLPAPFQFLPICCRLSKALVLDPPFYNALSYCWGDTKDVVQIKVNGKSLPVTRNLYEALRQLRQRAATIWLWVDAICINQADIAERNEQVSLMKKVYSSAANVLVWLGPEADDSELAISLIKAWAVWGDNDDDATIEGADFVAMVKAMSNPFGKEAWLAARKLFARPYWRRMWIFQELIFAKHVLVFCGSNKFSWSELGRAQLAWVQLSRPAFHGLVDSTAQRLVTLTDFNATSPIFLRGLLQKNDKRCEDISSLMNLTISRLADDPRDKIYALLGFEEIGILDLEPDYHAPVKMVYTDFMQRCVEMEGSLRILSLAGVGWETKGPELDLPSWTPDFRAQGAGSRPVSRSQKASASAGSRAEFTISDDRKALKARGMVFDALTDTAPYATTHTAISGHWLELIMRQETPYPSGLPTLQAFFRTIIADYSDDRVVRSSSLRGDDPDRFFDLAAGFLWSLGNYAMNEGKAAFNLQSGLDDRRVDTILGMNDYVVYFGLWSGHFPPSLTKQALLAPFLGDPELGTPPPLQWPPDADMYRGKKSKNTFMARTVHVCTKRSFFLTKGGYMGLGPRRIKKGDVLCILLGCNVPLVLRKQDQHYILVGECYVSGIMNGEALQQTPNGVAKFEDITIY